MVLAEDDVAKLQALAADLVSERCVEDLDDLPSRARLIRRSTETLAGLLALLAQDACRALNDGDALNLRAEADQACGYLHDLAGELSGPLLTAWRRREREQSAGRA